MKWRRKPRKPRAIIITAPEGLSQEEVLNLWLECGGQPGDLRIVITPPNAAQPPVGG